MEELKEEIEKLSNEELLGLDKEVDSLIEQINRIQKIEVDKNGSDQM